MPFHAYGLHTLQGVYPCLCASDFDMDILLCLKYLHPLEWYFSPVLVIYTVPPEPDALLLDAAFFTESDFTELYAPYSFAPVESEV